MRAWGQVIKPIEDKIKQKGGIMKKVLIISMSVIIAVMALGFIGTWLDKGYGKDGAIEWLSSELNLLKEQKLELSYINSEFSDFRERMRGDRYGLKEEFICVMTSDEFDAAKMMELVKEQQEQVDSFASRIIPKLADFHESLSAEQREKSVGILQEHSHGFGSESYLRRGNH